MTVLRSKSQSTTPQNTAPRYASLSNLLTHKLVKNLGKLVVASILPVLSLIPLTVAPSAMAEPTVIMNDIANNTDNNSTNNTADGVIAENPSNSIANNNSNANNTLASQLQPTQSELSQANQQLLSRNAQLQRDVNDLETQVNVLVNERSGQLFMYGVMTVIAGILVGIFIGWLVFVHRERW